MMKPNSRRVAEWWFAQGDADLTANAPQGNDAKCGFACHTIVKNRDYVFSEYGKR
jgi:hypothetical protein